MTPHWTTEITEPGWYWCRWSDGSEDEIVRLDQSLCVSVFGWWERVSISRASHFGFKLWSEPIKEPPE